MSLPTVHKLCGLPACIHLTITLNDHAVTYQTAAEWVRDHEDWLQWVSPDEREAAIAADSIWTCQWYPDTPVGFYVLAASTFDKLMAALSSA